MWPGTLTSEADLTSLMLSHIASLPLICTRWLEGMSVQLVTLALMLKVCLGASSCAQFAACRKNVYISSPPALYELSGPLANSLSTLHHKHLIRSEWAVLDIMKLRPCDTASYEA